MPNVAPRHPVSSLQPAQIPWTFERLGAQSRKEVFEHYLRLSHADLALRFGAAGTLATLRNYTSGLAFEADVILAARDARGVLVGIGQLMPLASGRGRAAEVAFSVDAAVRGRGLAQRLMAAVIDAARAQGIERLVAQVCPDNAPMLAVFRRAGMRLVREDGEMVGTLTVNACMHGHVLRAA